MHGGAAAEFAPAGLEASWTNALQLAGILPAASKQHKCTVQGCGYASARAGDLARHMKRGRHKGAVSLRVQKAAPKRRKGPEVEEESTSEEEAAEESAEETADEDEVEPSLPPGTHVLWKKHVEEDADEDVPEDVPAALPTQYCSTPEVCGLPCAALHKVRCFPCAAPRTLPASPRGPAAGPRSPPASPPASPPTSPPASPTWSASVERRCDRLLKNLAKADEKERKAGGGWRPSEPVPLHLKTEEGAYGWV